MIAPTTPRGSRVVLAEQTWAQRQGFTFLLGNGTAIVTQDFGRRSGFQDGFEYAERYQSLLPIRERSLPGVQ